MTNRDAQVLGAANNLDGRPANMVECIAEMGATTSGNTDRLSRVKVEARGNREGSETFFECAKVGNKIRTANGNIIGVETNVNRGSGSDKKVKDVHQEDEERGGEGAPLFDAGVKVDTCRVCSISGGETKSLVKERFNGTAVTRGETNGLDETKDGVVRDRIKCFFEVNEHDVVEFPVVEGRVKLFVEELDVAVNRHGRTEAMLVGREDGVKTGGNAFSNAGRNKSVVGVVDNKRSSVFNQHSRFFRKDIKEATVEARRGRGTIHKVLDTRMQDRSSNVGIGPVHSKGDVVRTRSRVVGIGDNRMHKFF